MKKLSILLLLTMVLALSFPATASPAPDWSADNICTRVASIAYYIQNVTIDASGKQVADTMVKTHIYGYEENGYRTQHVVYSPDGKQALIYNYMYDDVGPDMLQLSSIVEYDGPTKKLLSREKMSYDNVNNIVTGTKTDQSGKVISKNVYYANSNNLDYLVETYDVSGKLLSKTETEYDANNQMVLQVYSDVLTGQVTTTKREYNAEGIRVTKEIVENSNELIVNIFEYDDFDDNWIVMNSYRSQNGTLDGNSLILFETVYRLITPFG